MWPQVVFYHDFNFSWTSQWCVFNWCRLPVLFLLFCRVFNNIMTAGGLLACQTVRKMFSGIGLSMIGEDKTETGWNTIGHSKTEYDEFHCVYWKNSSWTHARYPIVIGLKIALHWKDFTTLEISQWRLFKLSSDNPHVKSRNELLILQSNLILKTLCRGFRGK